MRILPLLFLLASLAHAQTPIPTTWSPEIAVAKPMTEVGSQESPQVAFQGDELVVMWEEAGLRFRRLSGEAQTLATSIAPTHFALATTPASTFAVWTNYSAMYAGIVGEKPGWVTQARIPVAARNGDRFVVAWAARGFFHCAVFSAEGEQMRGLGAASPPRDVSRVMAIGASTKNVLAVWEAMDGRRGATLMGPENFVDIDSITLPEDRAWYFSVASDGRDFLVTWINLAGAQKDFIMGLRVGADGRTIGEPAIYGPGGDSKYAARVFWTGENYLLLWASRAEGGRSNLWATRIEADGTPIDLQPHPLGYIAGEVTSWACAGNRLAVGYVRSDGSSAKRAYMRTTLTPRTRMIRTR